MSDGITARQFRESDGVEDWRVLGEGASAYFRTGSFGAGARLAQAIGEIAGVDDHGPDVDLRHDGVTVRLITITDDYFGMSTRDVELARQISGGRAGAGGRRRPTRGPEPARRPRGAGHRRRVAILWKGGARV